MRGNAQRFAPRDRTKAEKLGGLLLELTSTRDHMLAGRTVDELIGRHGCDRQTTAYHLRIAQQNAAARAKESKT